MTVFFDIKKRYDKLNAGKTLEKLKEMGIITNGQRLLPYFILYIAHSIT